ncbi:Hermansky-Pudlak syndrome 4 protein isoform X1 [Alosa sapidissima]|uniref:Hermansky-Pudlak syndrome 4 protein isoform X1 n=1 Tax=Alosa sapidissima TaxID=34773 RepID=UPI001C0A57C7|nr:Hermansky-Pudlak syndrome 4 protein isoform X1 [Alosa sapidissima]XP_041956919.1 Hermansky-Pudlak syndrome 4 protein isoform X1 [Alosa sapidissima]
MADSPCPTDSRRCNYFLLYDGSKVQEEGDPTRAGICFFYPEETPLDQQELLCGQLAGVCRCVSELSLSPVRLLRLRRSKFAVRMKEHFLWALSCSVDIPDVSVCELLDQLISLFCFYNGPIRQSYLRHSRADLAVRWARYLTHLQGGSSELHHIFSCLRTIDSTHIDPLLLLKAALILQACQRCPLVLAGCILYRGRVVSTQMPPDLTVKVMVHETESYNQDHRPAANGISSASGTPSPCTGTTPVFLTPAELQALRSPPVDRTCRSHCTPQPPPRPRKSRLLSRTLSDTPPAEPAAATLDPQFSPVHQPENTGPANAKSHDHGLSNGIASCELKEEGVKSKMANGCVRKVEMGTGRSKMEASTDLILQNGNGRHTNGHHKEPASSCHSDQSSCEDELSDTSHHELLLNWSEPLIRLDSPETILEKKMKKLNMTKDNQESDEEERKANMKNGGRKIELNGGEGVKDGEKRETGMQGRVEGGVGELSSSLESESEVLLPMALYQHRVRALVLALLVEPHFHSDQAAVEEVYHSSLASLNGLEAHLGTSTAGGLGPLGPYTFAHYDSIQNTLTTNLSGRSVAPHDRSFVRATALLHSHFSQTQTLQEAIVRSAGAAVYGTRSTAQETYFLQHATSVRNSGIPNHQDSAFSLPSKARHRLLKHGVNLL